MCEMIMQAIHKQALYGFTTQRCTHFQKRGSRCSSSNERLYLFTLFLDRTLDKSDGKRRNTLGCLDQYTYNVLRLWNSWDRETV